MLDQGSGWESAQAALIVSRPGLALEAVDAALGLKGTEPRQAGTGLAVLAETSWSYRPTEKSTDVEQHITALVSDLLPLQGRLDGLRAQGYRMHIDVSGFVTSNSACQLNANTIALIEQLGIPISFTTRVAKGEDDSAWLESMLR
ncbi:DUF4279 domain-containing protein [Streptomyces abikoensis]|nr:DUF4279 domain-containing protein [Streptomyces luteoverticillatus]